MTDRGPTEHLARTGRARRPASPAAWVALVAVATALLLPTGPMPAGSASARSPDVQPMAVPLYEVTFTPTGLPSGAYWNLTVQGESVGATNVSPRTTGTTGTSVTLSLANGTYGYSSYGPQRAYSNGSFVVNGSNRTVQLSYSLLTNGPPSVPPSAAGAGLATASPYFGGIAVTVVLILVVVLVLVLVRRPSHRLPTLERSIETPARPPAGAEEDAAPAGLDADPLRHML